MKEGIHPEWYPEAEVICEGQVVMTIGATQPKIVVDVWSGTHPFYTGEAHLLDTEGQVDRFMRRLQAGKKKRKPKGPAKKARKPLIETIGADE